MAAGFDHVCAHASSTLEGVTIHLGRAISQMPFVASMTVEGWEARRGKGVASLD